MFEKFLKLLEELIAAIQANTAAQLGKASVKSTKKDEKPAETPAAPPVNSAPADTGITAPVLLAIAQKVLDVCAAKGMTGDQAGAARLKVVNTKHGLKPSQAAGQPQEKLAPFKADLEALLKEVEAAPESQM